MSSPFPDFEDDDAPTPVRWRGVVVWMIGTERMKSLLHLFPYPTACGVEAGDALVDVHLCTHTTVDEVVHVQCFLSRLRYDIRIGNAQGALGIVGLGNSSVSRQSGDDRPLYCFPCVNRVGVVS